VITLLLLRHAHAGDSSRWEGDDAVRPLTDKGRRQAERLARLLAATGEGPDLLITSPLARAAQTAEIVAGLLGARVLTDGRLAGPLDPDTVTRILVDAGPAERPCLVGHDPDLSELLGELTGATAVAMRKGALARVDLPGRAALPAATRRRPGSLTPAPDPDSHAAAHPALWANPAPAHRVAERRPRQDDVRVAVGRVGRPALRLDADRVRRL
jgi:phosphohistidine phosphatase